MAQRWSVEIKVGTFVVAGIALLIVFIFFIGDLSTALQRGYLLRVLFDSANGIEQGASAHYAGVEVGKVHAVRIVYPKSQPFIPQVELVIWLPRSVVVRSDDLASISTFGLLGEKYLEIAPGPGEGKILSADDQLIGKPTVSTERIIERSNEVLSDLKRTLEGINSLVGDPEARIYLKEALQEARDATRNWKALGERLNVAMSFAESGEGSLGKLLFDDELYQRMVAFVEDVREHPWKLLIKPPKLKKSEPNSRTPQ